MTMTLRILLVDDHTLFREALRLVLEKEPDFLVVGEAGNGADALRLAGEVLPNVVVMDIGMPGMNGIEATRQLLAVRPELRILAVSAYHDKRFIMHMREAGALGYVQKAAGRDEFLQAIRAVADGKPYLSQDMASQLIDSTDKKTKTQLGKRETEVLRLLARGMTSSAIAAELHIATGTVDVHRRNIMRKIDLHNIAALTKYSIDIGLMSD